MGGGAGGEGTFGAEACGCGVGRLGPGPTDFELGFLEVGFFGGAFAGGGAHFLVCGGGMGQVEGGGRGFGDTRSVMVVIAVMKVVVV